jgi:hypothetical protein
MARGVPVVIVLLIGPAAPAAAQESPASSAVSALVPAARVRVLTTALSIPSRGVLIKREGSALPVVGVVEAVQADALTVVPADGNPVIVPIGSVTAIDISVARKRNWLWGLVAGVGVGLAAGISAPVDRANCGEASENFCSRREAIGGFTLVLGGLGVAIGASIKTDRWERRFTRLTSTGILCAPTPPPAVTAQPATAANLQMEPTRACSWPRAAHVQR